MREYAISEVERASKSLSSAKRLIDEDPNSAASRAYYAVFHILTAVFSLEGKTFSKHSALRAALHFDLIKNNKWSPEIGKDFDFLLEIRETGDYGGINYVSKEDASLAIKKAENIILFSKGKYPELNIDK